MYGNEQQGRFLTVLPYTINLYSNNNGSQKVMYGDEVKEDIKNNIFARSLGNKAYELKDHLGNVRVTFSDIKMPKLFSTSYEVDLFSKYYALF